MTSLRDNPGVVDALARAVHRIDSCAKAWDELDPVEVDQYRSEAEHYASAVTAALSRQEAPERRHDRELMAAGLFSACAAQNALAAMARTPIGRARHERFAEWLEKFGQSLVDLGR
jgi:hypothetical protein